MFQDDFNDSDPLIQAMALHVLCRISNPTLIHKQLDSNSDKEKLGVMKTLIALMSNGHDVSEYFAHVIKNVTPQKVRKAYHA
ncbi:hypothetical protein EDD18DRAFT_1354452 [Armillaria luteobubalina]|uniref:Uncharacterized protein n=1 Tax=Armillaria luteobubalina TaxID=153913 RepID=A0AA39UN87_9AGAR|nr:hypothetical protein EDD18DRAFT_1354452 [Armillaria luteobubalina]